MLPGIAPATTAQEAGSHERLHGLDALRGLALLLGVVLHATLSFVPGPIAEVVDDDPTPVLGALCFAIHLFRMATFFWVAGFFAHRMLELRGTAGFVRDRLRRIAVPLVVFWPFVYASIVATIVWTIDEPTPPLAELVPEVGSLPRWPMLHLWFLWLLLLLYAGMLVLRGLVLAVDRSGALRRGIDRATNLVLGPWAALILALPLALCLVRIPEWLMWAGVPTPLNTLVPEVATVVGFGSAFLLGFLVHRQPALLQRFVAWWRLNLALAVVTGTTAAMLAGGAAPDLTLVPTPAHKAACAVSYAIGLFAGTFAAIGLALRYLAGASAVHRYLADASYWIYLVHLPIVDFGQACVMHLAWPWPVKFAVVIAGTLLVTIGSYQLLVRHSFMEALLAGKRRPGRFRDGFTDAGAWLRRTLRALRSTGRSRPR